jgi:two-component system phosphate regulon sensor histidine kinase PhoR
LVRVPAFVNHLQEGQFDQPVQFESPRTRSTLSVMVRPFGDGRLLVLSQDITERERMEAMRRDFVANVSHEIRTPLTVLAGFVETLLEVPLSESERARVLALMQTQSERMQALVSDLLTLAHLEGSPRPATDQWVAVTALMAQVRSVGEALSKGQHALQVGWAEGAELAGSSTEIQSALTNLVTNAVRYTPPGGAIQVSWSIRDDGAGVLEVADSGPGIAKEHLPRLTERFYRVDGGRSRETGGTGLGLSIVKHVIQRHGGQVDIASEVGKGSTFRLVFPAFRVKVAQKEVQGSDSTV